MAEWLWGCCYSVYFFCCRLMKWLLRLVTGRCELQRICHRHGPGATSTLKVENSLKQTKDKDLHDLVACRHTNIDSAVKLIASHKKVNTEKDPVFVEHIGVCLTKISGYNELWDEVEQHRKNPYNSDNPQHEEMLLKLWDLLMPAQRLEGRISQQWGDIGFQGTDPMTDFRGMGILGLENLLYFAEKHPAVARRLLTQSQHPKHGYSMAIVGINLTGLLYSLLTDGCLKYHFYNVIKGKPVLEEFHELYCDIFYEFNEFWFREKPPSLMEFNIYKDKFEAEIRQSLIKLNKTFVLPPEDTADKEDTMSLQSLDS